MYFITVALNCMSFSLVCPIHTKLFILFEYSAFTWKNRLYKFSSCSKFWIYSHMHTLWFYFFYTLLSTILYFNSNGFREVVLLWCHFLCHQTLKETDSWSVWKAEVCVCVFVCFPQRKKASESRWKREKCFQLPYLLCTSVRQFTHWTWKFILRIYQCQGIIFWCQSSVPPPKENNSRERSITHTHTHPAAEAPLMDAEVVGERFIGRSCWVWRSELQSSGIL